MILFSFKLDECVAKWTTELLSSAPQVRTLTLMITLPFVKTTLYLFFYSLTSVKMRFAFGLSLSIDLLSLCECVCDFLSILC